MKKQSLIKSIIIAGIISILSTGLLTKFRYDHFTFSNLPYPGQTVKFYSIDVYFILALVFILTSLVLIALRTIKRYRNKNNDAI